MALYWVGSRLHLGTSLAIVMRRNNWDMKKSDHRILHPLTSMMKHSSMRYFAVRKDKEAKIKSPVDESNASNAVRATKPGISSTVMQKMY